MVVHGLVSATYGATLPLFRHDRLQSAIPIGRVVFRPQVQRYGGVQNLLDPLARVARDLTLVPDLAQNGNDVLGLDLVELQLVQRLADNLHDAPELVVRSLVFQAGLIGLPPFLGELAEQARSVDASLLVVAVLSRIRSLGEKSQGVNRLVLCLGKLKARRLGRTKTHLFHDAIALVAERPAAAATWRDDQIKVVATRVFAGADRKVVLCGDFRPFDSKLHVKFELPSLGGKLGCLAREILTQIEGQLKGHSGGGWLATTSDGRRLSAMQESPVL